MDSRSSFLLRFNRFGHLLILCSIRTKQSRKIDLFLKFILSFSFSQMRQNKDYKYVSLARFTTPRNAHSYFVHLILISFSLCIYSLLSGSLLSQSSDLVLFISFSYFVLLSALSTRELSQIHAIVFNLIRWLPRKKPPPIFPLAAQRRILTLRYSWMEWDL